MSELKSIYSSDIFNVTYRILIRLVMMQLNLLIKHIKVKQLQIWIQEQNGMSFNPRYFCYKLLCHANRRIIWKAGYRNSKVSLCTGRDPLYRRCRQWHPYRNIAKMSSPLPQDYY
jgi:hypothetical protein